MNSTRSLIDSIAQVLSAAPSAICEDEFYVLDVKILSLGEALPVLKQLLHDVRSGIIEYDRAVVQVSDVNKRIIIDHVVRREEADIIIGNELPDQEWLCFNHANAYEQKIQEQGDEFRFDEWERYSLLQRIGDCAECKVNVWVEIALNKNHIENQFKERLAKDLPQFTRNFESLRIFYWADLDHFYSKIEEDLIQTNKRIADWEMPCLFICLYNAEDDGSDYFKSISTAGCVRREIVGPILEQLLKAPALEPISRSRQSQIQEYPDTVGYIPPEYWLSSHILARGLTDEDTPNWFVKVAPLFIYSMLASVSSNVYINKDYFRFEIKREFELALTCSISGDAISLGRETEKNKLDITHEALRQLLTFFNIAMQAKYTSVNHDLVQRSIVYGTSFDFQSFFSQLDRIKRFYEFEYKHLLGDRFEQQSRTLTAFISDMVSLRQQLAALIDSLSKDLSGLTIAVLATTALAIVAKIIDIDTWDNLVIYGMVTSFIFSYLYITVFLLRIDNLKNIGGRVVDEFLQDLKLGQHIWDFPLHTIGVKEKDIDREKILSPLLSQFNTNQWIAEASGIFSHSLFVVLTIILNLGWLLIPKSILDTIFLGLSTRNRTLNRNRFAYFLTTWFITLISAVIVYT